MPARLPQPTREPVRQPSGYFGANRFGNIIANIDEFGVELAKILAGRRGHISPKIHDDIKEARGLLALANCHIRQAQEHQNSEIPQNNEGERHGGA